VWLLRGLSHPWGRRQDRLEAVTVATIRFVVVGSEGAVAVQRLNADILLRAPDGCVLAVVEVKNRIGLTSEIAAEFRRNILEYSGLGVAPYFLLVSQDAGHLWRQSAGLGDAAPPDASFDMTRVVTRFAGEQAPDSRLMGFQLQSVMYQWLLDLAEGFDSADPQVVASLAATGFIDVVRGASVEAKPFADSLR
jgi:hypothetical protein